MSKTSQVEAIVSAALQKGTAHERASYLQSACGSDLELRQQVERRLNGHARVREASKTPMMESLVDEKAALLDATLAITVGPENKPEEAAPIANPSAAPRTDIKPPDDDDILPYLQPSTKAESLGRLGHYEVLEVLGQGGYGTVLRAFDEILRRVVAIKVM